MATLDDVVSKLGAPKTAVDNAVTAIGAGNVDPAKVQTISDAIDSATSTLTAATPVPPTP